MSNNHAPHERVGLIANNDSPGLGDHGVTPTLAPPLSGVSM